MTPSAATTGIIEQHPSRQLGLLDVGSEAALAALAGTSLIPALHTVALVRLRGNPETRTYGARRRAEGKGPREIRGAALSRPWCRSE
jgi:hypothetical protein